MIGIVITWFREGSLCSSFKKVGKQPSDCFLRELILRIWGSRSKTLKVGQPLKPVFWTRNLLNFSTKLAMELMYLSLYSASWLSSLQKFHLERISERYYCTTWWPKSFGAFDSHEIALIEVNLTFKWKIIIKTLIFSYGLRRKLGMWGKLLRQDHLWKFLLFSRATLWEKVQDFQLEPPHLFILYN